MSTDLKSHLRILLLDSAAGDWRRRFKASQEIEAWEKAGHPVPPPHLVKQRILSEYASAFNTGTLIETGTYLGDMIYAMKDHFENIFSIELADVFYKHARRRFRQYRHIEIRHGDSGEELAQVLNTVSSRCLFWLDGHYSAGFTAKGKTDTPVMNEVQIIFKHKIKDHVLLIDDARCFDGTHDYPTISELREFVGQHAENYEFSVKHDVIRIHPKQDGFSFKL